MTFLESKSLLSSLLLGDVKLPANEVLLPLFQQAFNHIANECIPLKLITKINDFSTLRMVSIDDEIRYIRKPRLPKVDGDTLDIDNELCFALINLVASYISKNKAGDFYMQSLEMISQYNWKLFNTRELLKDEQ